MKTSIAVCIPYYERIDLLRDSLQSMAKQNYGSWIYTKTKHEALHIYLSICDDGSMSQPLTYEWLARFGMPFLLAKTPPKKFWQNPCVPLNKAIRQCNSDIILTQSAENIHRMPIIDAMWRMIKDKKDVVLCPIKDTHPEKCSTKWKGWRSHPTHQPKKYWCCQMMTREFYEIVGGFDERYRAGYGGFEDDAFERTLTNAGANWIWLDEKYHVLHPFTEKNYAPEVSNISNQALFEQTAGEEVKRWNSH